ncbi:MAG: hypothetical protein IPP38_01955 [Bacteroidetes bacterium]|nr:hypothetical protein [Bacteroidota bacterium]
MESIRLRREENSSNWHSDSSIAGLGNSPGWDGNSNGWIQSSVIHQH